MKTYIILFFIYSFIGWILEVIYTLITDKKLINRGFFIGPVCPIYGSGALLMIILLSKFIDHPLAIFGLSIIIFSLLEYYTSLILEKMFNARWWDYSNHKYNLNGRICLETMVPFGILGLLVIYIINPFILKLISNIPNILILIVLVLFLIDIIISFEVILKIKNKFVLGMKDNTEEIKEKIKLILESQSVMVKRIFYSFPNLKKFIKKINNH